MSVHLTDSQTGGIPSGTPEASEAISRVGLHFHKSRWKPGRHLTAERPPSLFTESRRCLDCGGGIHSTSRRCKACQAEVYRVKHDLQKERGTRS